MLKIIFCVFNSSIFGFLTCAYAICVFSLILAGLAFAKFVKFLKTNMANADLNSQK